MAVIDDGDTLPREGRSGPASRHIETKSGPVRHGYRRRIQGVVVNKPFHQKDIRRSKGSDVREISADLSKVPITDVEVNALLVALKTQWMAILAMKVGATDASEVAATTAGGQPSDFETKENNRA